MKIAILTLPLHYNYGGNLQCYALVRTLQKLGHEVCNIAIIQEKQLPPIRRRPYIYTKRLINKLLGREYSCIFEEQKINKDRDIVHKFADKFICDNIPMTNHKYKNAQSLKELSKFGFDAFIVGSDQVWRPKYAFPDIRSFFLDFLEDNHYPLRISYAASFGTDANEYSDKQIKDCRYLFEQFNAVSVREKSALHLINDVFKWNCQTTPEHVLDPTILLEKEEYLNLLPSIATNSNSKGIFYYILDMTSDKRNLINILCKIKREKSFTVFPKSIFPGSKVEDKIVPPVEEWIQGFNAASLVITDSFHGCVFSIIFNKPFIVCVNRKRGATRFYSLLKMFDLENRIITDYADFDKFILNSSINWLKVNSVINEYKLKSLLFLQNALKR